MILEAYNSVAKIYESKEQQELCYVIPVVLILQDEEMLAQQTLLTC